MSRSHKKSPVQKAESFSKKYWKRVAAKKVRKSESVESGGDFKKHGDSYNINDYVSKCFTEKNKEQYEDRNPSFHMTMK
jgi:hypothetical protein